MSMWNRLRNVSIVFAFLSYTNATALKDAVRIEGQSGRITAHEFDSILATEIANEFGLHQLPTPDNRHLWNFASSFEWSRSKQIEEQSTNQQSHSGLRTHSNKQRRTTSNPSLVGSAPFVVCSMSYGTPGYSVRQQVEAYFGQNNIPLYNKVDKTCFLTTTTASMAENATTILDVHPLLPEGKIQEDTVDLIKYGDSPPTSFFVLLSPGWSNSKQEAEDIANDILGSIQDQDQQGRNLVAKTFLREDENHRRYLLLHDHLHHGREHKRALLWLDSFDEGITSDHQCSHVLLNITVEGSLDGDSFNIDMDEVLESDERACLLSIIAGLAVRPEVCSIGMNVEMQLNNAQAQWITQSGEQDERPWFDVGLTGRGQIVAVSDSGLDTDNCYFRDASGDVRKDGTIDKTKRKVVQYFNYADRFDYNDGHGTHVVGTLAGHKARDGVTETDGPGNGIAKDAKVAFFDLGRGGPRLSFPRNPATLLGSGRNAGANIHSASWGSDFNGYGFSERKMDDFMFKNEDFLVIIAAGNRGSRRNTVGSPATSKNCVSVGASQSSGPDIPASMRGKDYLAYFSSRGPTADGRTKPDVVAPGFSIKSAGARPGRVGECDDTLFSQSGTSMAAPVVSGSAALIRQYFEDGWFPTGSKNPSNPIITPSASLVKAVLLNGGQELLGSQNRWFTSSSEAYDVNQNFGRINLLESLPLAGKNSFGAQIMNNKEISNGDVDVISVSIDKSNGCSATELSTTLVWTDPPAMANCRACVLNDLDLRVIKNNNQNSPLFPNGQRSRDSTNNAERVRVSAEDGDKFDIIVEGKDLEEAFQKYSLIVTGCLSGQSSAVIPPSTTATGPTVSTITTTTIITTPTAQTITTRPPGPVPSSPARTGGSSLETTFDGRMASFGNMFHVMAKKPIIIRSIDLNLNSQSNNMPVEVWTTIGSLNLSKARSSSGWIQVASTNIQANGLGNPSPIPSSDFIPISLGQGDEAVLYVASSTPIIVTTTGSSYNNVFVSNDDVVIKEGTANNYPFGFFEISYVWNGLLRYDEPDGDLSLSTTFRPTYNYFGNMFDVNVRDNDIKITSMDIHISSTRRVSLQIYIKNGSYSNDEFDGSAWTLIGSGDVQGFGEGQRTLVPPEFFFSQGVILTAASTVAFYVTLTDEDAMLYTLSSSQFSDANLVIRSGAAKDYPFGESYSPRLWNGALHYEIL